MKKLLIITFWFEWTWWWKIAQVLENKLSKKFKTVTLIWGIDKGIYNIIWKKYYIWKFIWNKEFPLRWLISLFRHIINTIRYIRIENPDIVMAIWTYSNFLWLIAQKLLKIKLVLTQHESLIIYKWNNHLSTNWLIIKRIKKFIWKNKIICVSKKIMSEIINYYNIDKSQAILIYNWIDYKKIYSLSDEKLDIKYDYIINIWTLDDNKNQEMLIKSFWVLKNKTNYKLLLLWDWPNKNQLENLIEELNLKNKVKILWYVKNPYKYLKHAKAFVFTSKSESFWLSIVESLLLKVPIITTSCWGTAYEILQNGKYWTIIDSNDYKVFSKKLELHIDNYWSNTDEWKKYAESNFSQEKMINGYKEFLYKSLK